MCRTRIFAIANFTWTFAIQKQKARLPNSVILRYRIFPEPPLHSIGKLLAEISERFEFRAHFCSSKVG